MYHYQGYSKGLGTMVQHSDTYEGIDSSFIIKFPNLNLQLKRLKIYQHHIVYNTSTSS